MWYKTSLLALILGAGIYGVAPIVTKFDPLGASQAEAKVKLAKLHPTSGGGDDSNNDANEDAGNDDSGGDHGDGGGGGDDHGGDGRGGSDHGSGDHGHDGHDGGGN